MSVYRAVPFCRDGPYFHAAETKVKKFFHFVTLFSKIFHKIFSPPLRGAARTKKERLVIESLSSVYLLLLGAAALRNLEAVVEADVESGAVNLGSGAVALLGVGEHVVIVGDGHADVVGEIDFRTGDDTHVDA